MHRFTKMVLGITSLTGVEMILDSFLMELELSCAALYGNETNHSTAVSVECLPMYLAAKSNGL